jgi:hypothetical protein
MGTPAIGASQWSAHAGANQYLHLLPTVFAKIFVASVIVSAIGSGVLWNGTQINAGLRR